MTEQDHTQDDDRRRPEEPAEGAVRPGKPVPNREHTQEPAEGADDGRDEQDG